MSTQPDQLFHKNLDGAKQVAPSAAWDRIENNLDKRTIIRPWMKIAATLLMLITIAWCLWPDQVETKSLATNPEPPTPIATEPQQPPAYDSPQPSKIESEKIVESKAVVKNQPIVSPEKATHSFAATESIQEVSEDVDPIMTENTTSFTYASTNAQQSVAANEIAGQHQTLTYTANEVNQRFIKKTIVAEATPQEKNASGLQKLLSIAFELKNDETVYADLRQKKNEILSLNFLDSKKETNK